MVKRWRPGGKKPADLPPPRKEVRVDPASNARNCPKCGQECRVISNELGVGMHCIRCKEIWPISERITPPMETAPFGPRPLSKQTLVEPNWSTAYEDDQEYEYENVRRKKWEEG